MGNMHASVGAAAVASGHLALDHRGHRPRDQADSSGSTATEAAPIGTIAAGAVKLNDDHRRRRPQCKYLIVVPREPPAAPAVVPWGNRLIMWRNQLIVHN